MTIYICTGISFLVLAVSAYTDLRKGTVPNVPVYIALLTGCVLHLFDLPVHGYLLRIVLMAAVFSLYRGFIGGGDAKLLMMLIMLNGPETALFSMLTASLMAFAAALGIRRIRMRDILRIKKQSGKKIILAPWLLMAFLIVNTAGRYADLL